MIVLMLVAVSLILSLFLSSYSIRSLLFSYIARKEIRQKRLTSYFCKSLDTSVLEDSNPNKNIIFLNMDMKNSHTSYLQMDSFITKTKTSGRTNNVYNPFVSILVATYNERLVINRLMTSFAALTYNREEFEIIVVDDSEDNTFDILKKWEETIPNLKVIHRSERRGWKGGALNVALKNINTKSSYVLVVDADSILVNDTLERFVSCFSKYNSKGNCTDVIQGYPISRVFNLNDNNTNWVARAIEFRLAQRNIIEFLAKDITNLPIQITGSLFMIRSDLIKEVKFSNDLCEDWELTLDVYFPTNTISSYRYGKNINSCRNIDGKKVIFDPLLISYCEASTKLGSYFRQRMRVSEGHTRAFKRNLTKIMTSKIMFIDKLEFFFIGAQYSKFIPLLALIILDYILIISNEIDFIMKNDLMKITYLVQIANLLANIGTSLLAIPLCRNIKNYNIVDIFYLLLLNLCTIPAFVIGSLRGVFRREGIFYKTERNF